MEEKVTESILTSEQELTKDALEEFLNKTYTNGDESFNVKVERIRSFGKGRHEVEIVGSLHGNQKRLKLKVSGKLIPINVIRSILNI